MKDISKLSDAELENIINGETKPRRKSTSVGEDIQNIGSNLYNFAKNCYLLLTITIFI